MLFKSTLFSLYSNLLTLYNQKKFFYIQFSRIKAFATCADVCVNFVAQLILVKVVNITLQCLSKYIIGKLPYGKLVCVILIQLWRGIKNSLNRCTHSSASDSSQIVNKNPPHQPWRWFRYCPKANANFGKSRSLTEFISVGNSERLTVSALWIDLNNLWDHLKVHLVQQWSFQRLPFWAHPKWICVAVVTDHGNHEYVLSQYTDHQTDEWTV